MRHRLPLLTAAGIMLAAFAAPSSALASHGGSNCNYTALQQLILISDTGGTAVVYVDFDGSGGTSGDPGTDVVAGACVNTEGQPVEGGTVEVGGGEDIGSGPADPDPPLPDAYVVIDGDNENAPLTGFEDGYVGLSSWENGGARDAECEGSGPGEGWPESTNSGGCFGVDGGPWVTLLLPQTGGGEIPTPICGNEHGNTWDNTAEDGCSLP